MEGLTVRLVNVDPTSKEYTSTMELFNATLKNITVHKVQHHRST